MTASIQKKKTTKNEYYYVVLYYKDSMGKNKTKWVNTHLTTEKPYKKELQAFKQKALTDNQHLESCSGMYLHEYFKYWLTTVESKVRYNTFKGYRSSMQMHIIPYYQTHKVKLCDISVCTFQRYIDFVTSEGALENKTIHNHKGIITKALNDAIRNGLIQYNYAEKVVTPKVEQHKASIYNATQINELLSVIKEQKSEIYIPVYLIAFYGLRRSEVCGLTWDCIDFENKTITIEKTMHKAIGGYSIESTKNNSSYRTLPLLDEVAFQLRIHKHNQNKIKKSEGYNAEYNELDFINIWESGKPILPDYVTEQFRRILRNNNLPSIRLHDLRHTIASLLLNNGTNIKQIQEWLGHSTPTTTLNIYSHLADNTKIPTANTVKMLLFDDKE